MASKKTAPKADCIVGEYKGSPTLTISLYDPASGFQTKVGFGVRKWALVLANIDAIRLFVNEAGDQPTEEAA